MSSKDTSNLIISLLVLGVGIKIVTILAKGYIKAPVPGISEELVNSIDSLGNLLVLGIGIFILILIPFYLSKRSEEKKAAKTMKANP